MSERHKHLTLTRSEPIHARRTGPGFGTKPPADPQAHGRQLAEAFKRTLTNPVAEPGFDPRRLLKLEVDGLAPSELEAVGGLEVVSQEGRKIVVLFASAEGQQDFLRRVHLLSRGGKPQRQDILFAVKGVDEWSRADRMGPALAVEGFPAQTTFVIDVELWPLDRRSQRDQMLKAFDDWCRVAGVTVHDHVNQEVVVLYRITTDVAGCERLLLHRDVRTVDLPPKYELSESELLVGINEVEAISPPGESAPSIVVLDSGVAANHPLLAPAMGDAQSFIKPLGPDDEHGHGTAVAGLALYGDVAAAMASRTFTPRLWIFSGRISDGDAENNTGFIENHIAAAVEYFTKEYGSRIFVLSFGDRRKPYADGHVRGLAAVLDELARRYGVLFVVSAGNYEGADPGLIPPLWKTHYPSYLLERPTARLLDPAPALNVLSVGSLARYDTPRTAQRHPTDPAYQPVARKEQPSPFSCCGPGPGGAIKPDVVEYGGNFGVDMRDVAQNCQRNALLGEAAPAHNFATGGRLLRDFVGTSFAAPRIANLAGQLLVEYPTASANLLRALIIAHASVPDAAKEMKISEEELRRMTGYGRPRAERSQFSSARCVSLMAEGSIGEDQHHYYEIPLPADFLTPSRRDRAITVAIAHTPFVRTTRFDYRGSRLSFRLVAAHDLADVTRVFQRTPTHQREELINEFRKPSVGSTIRDKGTAQLATYEVKALDQAARKKRLFVVVTRKVPSWATGEIFEEPYALVVALEDRSQVQVQYYLQILEIQERQRARVRQ